MKKLIIILLGYLLLISCKEKKTEFIQSKAIGDLYLLKNHPKYDNQINRIDFYKYTYNTKYFIDHKEDDPSGLSLGEEQLSFYDNDRIAVFIISKCKNDSTKLVGELYFYGLESRVAKIDTLIYKCN